MQYKSGPAVFLLCTHHDLRLRHVCAHVRVCLRVYCVLVCVYVFVFPRARALALF